MADLVTERYRKFVKELPSEKRDKPSLFCMNGKTYTPDQVLDEMERDTDAGKVFKRAEEKLLERTLERKREAGL